VPGVDERELLTSRGARARERASLAAAVLAAARERALVLPDVHDFRALPGRASVGRADADGSREVALGNAACSRSSASRRRCSTARRELRRDGRTVAFVALDGHVAG
jgi:Cu+-exporting ATPase